MGSREKDQTTSHHPLLSSLVVRPSDTVGSGVGTGGGGAVSDYEPGEVRRDPPPYSRSDRYGSDDRGYRMRAGSVSPVRRRDADRRYSPGFDPTPRGRGYGSGRDLGRYREHSPPYGRGRGGGRFSGRGYDGPGYGPGPFRGEGLARNNPNVRPREGDWICPDPTCKNLNFARREHCNNCNRFRYAPAVSPRRGYPGPPPPPGRRFPGPPMDRSPGRIVNGHRSPPRSWARDGARDLRAAAPPRTEGRFPEPPLRRDETDFPVNEYRDRYRFDRLVPLDLGPRDRGRENFINDRRGFERRPLSPPLPAPARGQWGRDLRERSRSPIRGGLPPKDYHREIYMDRGRDDRRGMGRVTF